MQFYEICYDISVMNIGLYIHIPYCRRKCSYCGFFSTPQADGCIPDDYLNCLSQEMALYHARFGRLEVDTVFIGGGTPSLLSAAQIETLMRDVRKHFRLANGTEITFEANPDSLTDDVLLAMRGQGVNRLSIGAQSLDNTLLDSLGRIHDRTVFLSAFARARAQGFTNLNIDLMFGIPGQSYEQWMDTLKETEALAPAHLSLYTIQLEEGTPLYEAYRRGEVDLPAVSLDRRMYHDGISMLGQYGYAQYEISNFAKEGYACRHNLKYWSMAPFLGLGPSAASYFDGRRYQNPPDPAAWTASLEAGKLVIDNAPQEPLSDAMEVFCFTALRTAEGLDTARFADRFGQSLEEAYRDDPPPVDTWIRDGLMRKDGTRLVLTKAGIDVSNDIMSAFMRTNG